MNKEWLIFCTTCGDDYTYSFEKAIPFQYSSKKDVENLLLEYAYELLELVVPCMNGNVPEKWSEYHQWLAENPFFSDFELDFNDLWYYNKNYSKNPPKKYKASDYELVSFRIYTLWEWAEANEEKVKYSSKVV